MRNKPLKDHLWNLLARIPRRVWTACAILTALAIIFMGLRPAGQIPSGIFFFPHQDKILHFLAYAFLATLVYRSIYPFHPEREPHGRFPWLPILLVPFVLGSLDEYFQGLTGTRTRDPYDLLADTMAGILVCAVALRWRHLARRRLEAYRRGRRIARRKKASKARRPTGNSGSFRSGKLAGR